MSCVSDLRLDEWVAGRRSSQVAAHLETCARCAGRLHERERAQADFAARARPAAFADAVLARRQPRTLMWPSLVATFACVCFVVWRLVPATPPLGYKAGAADALLFVQRGDVVGAYDPARRYQAGDRVQVVVLSPAPVWVTVVDVEEGGATSVLFSSTAPLAAGRSALPRSFELDGWRGAERFVVLFGTSPIDDATGRARRGEGRSFPIRR